MKRANAEPERDRGGSTYARQDATGSTVLAYLLAGPILYGGLGWLGDRLLHTSFLTLVGLLAGMAMSLYVVWLRYGKT